MAVKGQFPVTVFFNSKDDVNKLNLQVKVDELDYDPKSKKKNVILDVKLVFPETQYTYGDSCITGDAESHRKYLYEFDTSAEINKTINWVTKKGQDELMHIKAEIEELLVFGQRVKIDLTATMDRITHAIRD
jgi:hypothetical protein